MSAAALAYLAITAATAGFTGCAFAADKIAGKPSAHWAVLCAASIGACVAFIATKAT